MTYYVRSIDGNIEIIDGEWLHLYLPATEDGNPAEPAEHGLIALTDEQYQEYLARIDDYPQLVNGKLVYRNHCPSAAHSWDGKKWVLNKDAAAKIKAEQQDEMWERIKAKRQDNLRHGVYVKSVGKWYHTDDASRTQYIALGILPALPSDLSWKTMDNSFVPMTKAILQELMLAMLADEQADFANAERHRAAMLKADKPLDYDYSAGWTVNYETKEA